MIAVGLGPWADDQAPQQAVRAAFRAARALARRWRAGSAPGLFVTVQDTGGDFGLSGPSPRDALAGGLCGLTRTVAREHPDARVLALDIAAGGRAADAVAADIERELFLAGAEIERGVSADGRRITLTDLEAPPLTRGGRLRRGDVVVVTGGARGVTATCLLALLRALPLKLVLLGRTALADEPAETRGIEDEAGLRRALLGLAKAKGEAISPAALASRAAAVRANREAAANMDAMTALGAEVLYLPVDVQSAAALAAGLADVRRRWGPIAGVVHGAGVLADALVADKEDAAFDRVFETKVQGFTNLLTATAEDPLRLIAAFSSVAGRYGNPGQCDYAAANEILNQRCRVEAKARPDARVVSLGWGPWDGGMVTPELRAMFAARNVPLLSQEGGAALFVDEVLATEGAPAVILGGRLTAERMAPSDQPWEEEVLVSAATHPWLTDHTVQDVPVLPVVQVVEIFAAAMSRGWPGLRLRQLTKLSVLRGAPLPDFQTGHRFRVVCTPIAAGHVGLAFYDVGGGPAPRYRAEAHLGVDLPSLQAASPPEGALLPWEGDPYAQALFHGPAFQGLRGVAVGEGGATAEILPLCRGDAVAEGWELGSPNAAGWSSDPLALDCALQLGLLWGWEPFGGRSLPTGIGRLSFGVSGAWGGVVRASLRVLASDERQARFRIELADEAGNALATLDEVSFHAVPSGQRGVA